jgi:hypothetical protein
MAFKTVVERDELIKSMETHNFELMKVIEEYRQIEKVKYPEINDDDKISPENQELMVHSYWEHRISLEKMIKCSNKLKISIDNFNAYFEETEEDKQLKKHIAEMLKKRDEMNNH